MTSLAIVLLAPVLAGLCASLAVVGVWGVTRTRPRTLVDLREQWVRTVLRAGWSEGEYVDSSVHVVRTSDGWRVCWAGQAFYETVSTARLRVVLRDTWDEARETARVELAGGA